MVNVRMFVSSVSMNLISAYSCAILYIFSFLMLMPRVYVGLFSEWTATIGCEYMLFDELSLLDRLS